MESAKREPKFRKIQTQNNNGVQKDLDKTPEFFIPDLGLEVEEYIKVERKQGIHHLARYHWAKQVLESYKSRKILDIACGVGYGSYILARHLTDSEIVGGEYDDRGIDHAKKNYARDNLSYVDANMVTWKSTTETGTQNLGQYDAIVSFDTIEHLLHREIALIRVTQNLLDHGVFLLSTPCAHEVTRLNPGWEHHKIEYSHHDLRNLLKRFFGTVLIPENNQFPFMDYWDEVINKDEWLYVNKSNPIVCLDPIKL